LKRGWRLGDATPGIGPKVTVADITLGGDTGSHRIEGTVTADDRRTSEAVPRPDKVEASPQRLGLRWRPGCSSRLEGVAGSNRPSTDGSSCSNAERDDSDESSSCEPSSGTIKQSCGSRPALCSDRLSCRHASGSAERGDGEASSSDEPSSGTIKPSSIDGSAHGGRPSYGRGLAESAYGDTPTSGSIEPSNGSIKPASNDGSASRLCDGDASSSCGPLCSTRPASHKSSGSTARALAAALVDGEAPSGNKACSPATKLRTWKREATYTATELPGDRDSNCDCD